MNKLRKFLCILLCAVLCFSLCSVVSASEDKLILRIVSAEGFLNFAENCRLDSYSQGLTVLLCRDIDLSDTDFSGIPTFSGIFDGQGYQVSGLSISSEGSNAGLFRYLTATATVQNLSVSGNITPGGSGSHVGGIAGSNAGRITHCSFSGNVSGIDNIGGIAGTNQLSGIITDCTVSGSIHGNHFVGGIAGENLGVIHKCGNFAQVNTTIEQNQVELEDISLGSITGSESAATVTDIGGICGTGTGIIRDCVNHGTVGYPLLGYNVGGIAGSFSGYLAGCINLGTIDGRKEVGGIVGQLEPAVSVLYEEDTLQTLQKQLDEMSATASGAGAAAQGSANALGVQADKLDEHFEDAKDALSMLIPDPDNPTMPDEDTLKAAQNALSSSLSGISESLNNMAVISESTIGSLSGSIQSLSGQMNAISGTIGTASENLGATFTDVSDADTADDISAKVHLCTNLGTVSGDLNVGGITGAMSLENDLDPESDVSISGSASLNFDMELRAVVLDCQNKGTVLCKKRNAGGIAGWVSLGLVKQCINSGAVDAASADYAGGIAGSSSGYIRQCNVRCVVSGDTYVGGIAGNGATVTDCSVIVRLTDAAEKAGAILGVLEDAQLQSNHYLPIEGDPGGVDGIRYAGKADALSAESFFSLPGVPGSFRMVCITFRLSDGTARSISLPYGSVLTEALFPAVTDDYGSEAVWAGPIEAGDPIFYDAEFSPIFPAHDTTLASALTGRNGLPQLLAQGSFLHGEQLTVNGFNEPDAIAAWEVILPESTAAIKLRCLIPDNYSADDVVLMVRAGSVWQEANTTADGSYLVFYAPDDIQAVCFLEAPADYSAILFPVILVLCLFAGVIAVICLKRRSKKNK